MLSFKVWNTSSNGKKLTNWRINIEFLGKCYQWIFLFSFIFYHYFLLYYIYLFFRILSCCQYMYVVLTNFCSFENNHFLCFIQKKLFIQSWHPYYSEIKCKFVLYAVGTRNMLIEQVWREWMGLYVHILNKSTKAALHFVWKLVILAKQQADRSIDWWSGTLLFRNFNGIYSRKSERQERVMWNLAFWDVSVRNSTINIL